MHAILHYFEKIACIFVQNSFRNHQVFPIAIFFCGAPVLINVWFWCSFGQNSKTDKQSCNILIETKQDSKWKYDKY